MNNAFSGQILAEKLSKLNNSQQSIETLSHWCIFHRKKAKLVVETWDKLFNSSQREQQVSFLYLANDILQNSRRKGSEFVNEFWKVLPAAIKDVFGNSDDHGKKAVSRLVDIWEERKVFGSRGRNLKDEILGKDPPPLLENNGKSSNPIRIVKKDAHSIRIKLAVGGMPEKIITAFQLVHEEHFKEDTALNKCKASVRRVGKMEKDIDSACTQGDQQASSTLGNDLQEQENILRQCIEQLESVEGTRVALVGQLKEALQDQESKLELIRTQLQVAQAQVEQASNMRQRLGSAPVPFPSPPPTTTTLPVVETSVVEPNPLPIQTTSQPPLLQQPVTSFATPKTSTEDEQKKAAAAAVAAKLAAMTSSAQMLTSVLSSLAAEEAASMNSGVKSVGFTSMFLPPEKRPKLEKPMLVSDMGNNSAYFAPHVQQPNHPPTPTTTNMQQPISQANNQVQSQFPPPPPPPLPLAPPPSVHSYAQQSNNLMVGAMPYGYGAANGLPPPPPLPTHMVMGLARPGTQPQQQQQPPATGGYFHPPGNGFYGQNHQQPTPPLPRQ